MAIVYMKKLEEEPDTYDEKFTKLTEGINLDVRERILEIVPDNKKVLEIGCGPGTLAYQLALKGNEVLALDKNPEMIELASNNYMDTEKINLIYEVNTIEDYKGEPNTYDFIVSTFMLSELRPLEHQIFLRKAWKLLKHSGKLIIAAEFSPKGFWKIPFKFKRWRYRKKLGRLKKITNPLKWFTNYIEPIGYEINKIEEWKKGSIKLLELEKIAKTKIDTPGYYNPPFRKFKGISSQLRIYRCLLTGQMDKVPIEPGIYISGNPDKSSPIIVTANYEYTYIRVMRDLKDVDAWVLCLDSNGINVWCAARGNEFGNEQLFEIVKATNIISLSDSKILILPQLSAGGVETRILPNPSEDFPYQVKFGPVWAEDLPEYLKNKPTPKPERMRIAQFNFRHRIKAVITHTSFLLRKIFLLPAILIISFLVGLNFFFPIESKYWKVIGEFFLWFLNINILILLLFPLTKFTKKFITKAIIFGMVNVAVSGFVTYMIHKSLVITLGSLPLIFWLGFFCTMSFSGYTMETNPKEIQEEYKSFKIINLPLFIVAIVLVVLVPILFS
ncbi:MAG: methyltransferase domain-containing protein [Candidatus Lokiarchaeota archaeon]|nr:methyltransferase domain-containing protein [Candidatus Lokiarchaeota archaeon]MBD3201055.1 methyltransferase domain-containing protein [Candidatus Lokiarchaeota archaeon]